MSRDLSVVVPAYNEADRIGITLDSIASYLDGRDLDDEVIVVDDGSTDDPHGIAERMGVDFIRQDRCGPGAARNRLRDGRR